MCCEEFKARNGHIPTIFRDMWNEYCYKKKDCCFEANDKVIMIIDVDSYLYKHIKFNEKEKVD